RYGLTGDPVAAETSAVAALLEQVRDTQVPVHLMQVSTARSLELIATAKAAGLPITASTTWMHLLHSTRSLQTYDPSLRLDPPLGNPEDQTALVEAVQAGVIDAIAINHRAYTYEEKTVGFATAPAGAIGLPLALPLLWHHHAKVAPLPWLRALSTAPAQIFGQMPPSLAVGEPAEMTLFDPAQPWVAHSQSLKTPAQNTPWYGLEIQGQVIKTWQAPMAQ
ncbi:dihydroorotase, partial [filamentous cyanobacterium CCP5]